jgi:hypothetical protein
VGEKKGVGWLVKEGVGEGGEMTQTVYAHMNKIKIKKQKKTECHPK